MAITKQTKEPLAVTNPDLANEWNYKKNTNLTPIDITAGSNKKAWWKCSKGHEWEAKICNRSQGKGCPVCGIAKRGKTRSELAIKCNGSLQDNYPEVAKLWHPTKNGLLKPADVSAMSHQKVWWQCEVCNQDWEAIISNCAKGHGCPYCSGRATRTGINDLQTLRPALVKEWHPIKNGQLSPSDVSFMSNKKAWWICSLCGNEWFAGIAGRSAGNGCPQCAAEKRTSFPEQAVYYYLSQYYEAINRYIENNYELDIFLPLIKTGIEYDGRYYHNSSKSAQKETKKDTYFLSKNINVIRIKESEKNSVDNSVIYYRFSESYSELKWAINTLFLMIDSTNMPDIDLLRDQPKIDALYIKTIKENSFATQYPDLVKEWNTDRNIISPEMVSKSSGKKAWWKCDKGHEWQASIRDRARGSRCPFCSNQKVLSGFNDLETRKPKLAKEWDYEKNGTLTPKDVTSNTHKKVWWKCSEGHCWEAKISNRSNGTGCPYCSGRTAISGETDLQTLFPDLAKEWHPTKNGNLNPAKITAYNNKKAWWLCPLCRNEWETSIYTRTTGSACPSCAKKKRGTTYAKNNVTKNGSLLDINPKLAKEWNKSKNGKLTPSDISPKSNRKVWWQCSKGHEWEAPVNNRAAGNGCPICSGYQVLSGYNDLASQKPEIAKDWDYENNGELTPSTVYVNSTKKVCWKCSECGYEWKTAIAYRSRGTGCPRCAKKNARKTKPS